MYSTRSWRGSARRPLERGQAQASPLIPTNMSYRMHYAAVLALLALTVPFAAAQTDGVRAAGHQAAPPARPWFSIYGSGETCKGGPNATEMGGSSWDKHGGGRQRYDPAPAGAHLLCTAQPRARQLALGRGTSCTCVAQCCSRMRRPTCAAGARPPPNHACTRRAHWCRRHPTHPPRATHTHARTTHHTPVHAPPPPGV